MCDSTPGPVRTTQPRRLLRCEACGGCQVGSPEDLLRYTREGWPRCCGQVMVLFTEILLPRPADSATGGLPQPGG